MMRNGDKEHLNLWWDHLNIKNKKEFFSLLLMSKNARKIACAKYPIKEIKSKLHLEHITPVGWIYHRLCGLSKKMGAALTAKDIIVELEYNRLVLLTKKESKLYLDGAKQGFRVKDVEMLHRYFPLFANTHAEELAQLVEHGRAKDSGFGLLRMAKLVNFGVSFVYNDATPCPPKEWMKYFTNTRFTIT